MKTKTVRQKREDPVLVAWTKRLEKIISFMENITPQSSPHGEEWERGMKRYYISRAKVLLAGIPKGGEKRAAAFAARLEKL